MSKVQRAFTNVIEIVEADAYPIFSGNQMRAEDKVGELAALFGGFAIYLKEDKGQCYVLTTASPTPSQRVKTGFLSGNPIYVADRLEQIAALIRTRLRKAGA